MFNQHVDKVYCLSLPHRTDRRKHFTEEAELLDFKFDFWDAIGAADWPDGNFKPFYIAKHYIQFSKGYYCQNIGMKQIFEDAKKNKYKRILIFEDDATFRNHSFSVDIFDKAMQDLQAKNIEFDLFYLGGTHKIHPQLITPNLCKVKHTYDAHAVVYSDQMFDLALHFLSLNDFVYDHFLVDYIQPRGLSFSLPKDICIQYDNYSDGLNRDVKNKYYGKISY